MLSDTLLQRVRVQFTEVAFGYSRSKILYSGVDLGVDLDSRVAVVGPNGAGKSTLLKLMTGELEPVDGVVKRHNHLRIGVYHQHLTEKLTPDETPLEYMMREFGVCSSHSCMSFSREPWRSPHNLRRHACFVAATVQPSLVLHT